jgi:hypothetical protein
MELSPLDNHPRGTGPAFAERFRYEPVTFNYTSLSMHFDPLLAVFFQLHTATVPIARKSNGESIAGPTFAQFIDIAAGSPGVELQRSVGPLVLPPVAPASLDMRKAQLLHQLTPDAEPVEIAADNGAFADCRSEAFPDDPMRNSFQCEAVSSLMLHMAWYTRQKIQRCRESVLPPLAIRLHSCDTRKTHPIHWLERFTKQLHSVFRKRVIS